MGTTKYSESTSFEEMAEQVENSDLVSSSVKEEVTPVETDETTE